MSRLNLPFHSSSGYSTHNEFGRYGRAQRIGNLVGILADAAVAVSYRSEGIVEALLAIMPPNAL